MALAAEISSTLSVGDAVFYMQVGTHADETLEQIVARKSHEIEEHGFTLWGYGGTTCHPVSIVQPFAEEFARNGHLPLLMERTNDNHFALGKTAAEYSKNGVEWQKIPPGIEVKGSRYALMIDELEATDFALELERTVVPIGPNTGRPGNHYVQGLVDKACLQLIADAPPEGGEKNHRRIEFKANIRAPFAVFLKGFRD